jgi:hypothetical protein
VQRWIDPAAEHFSWYWVAEEGEDATGLVPDYVCGLVVAELFLISLFRDS